MKFSFRATIYKVGINPCVKVPKRITNELTASKGYIRITGKIDGHDFKQTLVPVKDAPYRLFVNGPMMKSAEVEVGDTASFVIEQDNDNKSRDVPMPRNFKARLVKDGVWEAYKSLTPYRQKEILKYLSFLKTEESISRNIEKVVQQLKEKNQSR